MFKDFKQAVQRHFETIKDCPLVRVDVSGDEMWDLYLNSFPDGTNPIFRMRSEYDCQCCKQFVRNIGNVVALVNGKKVSVWDIDVGGHYQAVADALALRAETAAIKNVFMSEWRLIGTDKTRQLTDEGTIEWEHFSVSLPDARVVPDLGRVLGSTYSSHEVFRRALDEITADAIATVCELIEQGSLYRGEEHLPLVRKFALVHEQYQGLGPGAKDIFCWEHLPADGLARIRNTVIGTLLVALSGGCSLESSVKAFETKVAPANYKRPTALVTAAMVTRAQETVEALGYTSALARRYATIDDITINNVLFADREAKRALDGDVFEDITRSLPDNPKRLGKVEVVSIDQFLRDILPKAECIDIRVDTRHEGNLFSLVAPENSTSKGMFAWPNNFSWAYNGALADSVRARVKSAGGDVDGDFRASLAWYNKDDLDIHLHEPCGNHISFGKKTNVKTRGELDVDMNVNNLVRNAVENITYPDKAKMGEGRYELRVHNYTKRESIDVGFEVEVEFGGEVLSFVHPKAVPGNKSVSVLTFDYSHKDGIKVVKSIPKSTASKEIWGITTQKFHRVVTILNSPNHWDGTAVGNRHTFFVVEGCANEEGARGFFNEFLTADLSEHRKVFEIVGAKMKTPESADQLSGLGFSSTQRNSAFVRVTGAFTRTLEVLF